MSSPPDQPHLFSLVLESKKALQHGEQLCSRAHAISNASANTSIDIVALDARVRWVTEAVGEQLKLVASVAKSIEEKRAHMGKQVLDWDKQRTKHSDALDNVLESLGAQLVPPDFHQSASADSSLFGSQHSDQGPSHHPGERRANGSVVSAVSHSPSSTLRGGFRNGRQDVKENERPDAEADKRIWKTLRDFVDDQAIEDILESMENDRLGIDYIMSKTDEYPETLATAIESIRESLPALPDDPPMKFTEELLAEQDTIVTTMAAHLESLTSHYGQMSNALQESEAGEAFSDEDIDEMNRDTDELPSIMAELGVSADAIEDCHEKLLAAKETYQTHLSLLTHTLDDLDELGDIMPEMLQTQEMAETKCEEELNGLQNHLSTLEHLRERFVSYQTAFNKLILELARRRQYREAAENIVRGMMVQLEAMTEGGPALLLAALTHVELSTSVEESQVRSHFNSEYGGHLPEDICLCVGNAPTRWEVLPLSGDPLSEFLPVIDTELVTVLAYNELRSLSLPPPWSLAMRLLYFLFAFPVIGTLAGQVPVINGIFGGGSMAPEKFDYPKKPVLLATSNATSPGPIRMVENSGICETTPNVYQASGYVDIATNQSIWFWFFASRQNPDTAPLALWFNGGPGSSSMIGLFQEHGPCRITNDSSSVTLNPYSWNNEANVLYIDQPVGVGFSHGNSSVGTSQQAASDIWTFMQLFFNDNRFSKYQKNDLAIWTESYGGHYGPIFAAHFLSQNANIASGSLQGTPLNLKVLGIGNGLTDPLVQYPGYAVYAASNPYHPLVSSSVIDAANKAWTDTNGCKDQVYYVPTKSPDPYPPNITSYLGTIGSKIGVEKTWEESNLEVYASFTFAGDWMRNARPYLETVINAGVDALSTNLTSTYSKQQFTPWMVAGQPAGQYKEAGTFSYLRVFGAGHEVPAYKYGTLETGQAAAKMFTTVMAGQSLATTNTTTSDSSASSFKFWTSLCVTSVIGIVYYNSFL
ncbi:hypothetical protein DXG01_014232 [Tephrocybe rancida]|nr:hypothetical protein DXG01_014232 [Tephrocybe rancida]